jgi:DNA-binding NarL/FixJ family response regulator
MNTPIRIVIADDHVLVRQGIRAFLETHPDSKSSAKPRTRRAQRSCASRANPTSRWWIW